MDSGDENLDPWEEFEDDPRDDDVYDYMHSGAHSPNTVHEYEEQCFELDDREILANWDCPVETSLLRNYGVDPRDPTKRISQRMLTCQYAKHMSDLFRIEKKHAITPLRSERFERARAICFSTYRIAVYTCIVQEALDGVDLNVLSVRDEDIIRYETMKAFSTPEKEMSGAKVVEHYLLSRAHELGLRRSMDGEMLYRPYYNDKNQRTASFVVDCKVSEFLYREINMERNLAMFQRLPDNPSSVITYLQRCQESRLPTYDPDRSIHGFENGFYDIEHNRMRFYDDTLGDIGENISVQMHRGMHLEREWMKPPLQTADERYYCFPVDPSVFKDKDTQLPEGWVLRDERMYMPAGDEPPPPLHIPTPAWDKLMFGQEWDVNMAVWFMGMIGRLCFYVKQHDAWDVIFVMSGATKAGKSTSINVLPAIFFPDRSRIGVLSSNKEEKFGLQKLWDKDVIVCDEMEQKPSWNLGEIKSMAAGGFMSIAVKNGNPVFIRWRAHIVVGTNFTSPRWADPSGAIVRRFAPFHFPISYLNNEDTTLEQRMLDEGAAFFVKAIQCYHYLLRKYPKQAFSQIAPRQVMALREQMEREMSPFLRFLEDGEHVYIREDYYCPVDTLRREFLKYCKDEGVAYSADSDFKQDVKRILAKKGCSVEDKRRRLAYPRGSGGVRRAIFVYGIDVRDDSPPATEEEQHESDSYNCSHNP